MTSFLNAYTPKYVTSFSHLLSLWVRDVIFERPLIIFVEVERMVTPETSYENLVAQQSTEIEDAMMNEVQKFYI